jgi:hypothetical protein
MNTRAAAVFAFSLMLAMASCAQNKTVTDKETRDRKEASLQQTFLAFAAAHNAVADWKTALPYQSLGGAYSIQLGDVLVRPDKRPVAFRAYLDDIVRRRDRTYLELEDVDEPDGLHLTLEATSENVQQILKQGPSNFDQYAVVAEILTVERPAFQLSAENNPDGPEIQVKASDTFHAQGRCLDLVYLSGLRHPPQPASH